MKLMKTGQITVDGYDFTSQHLTIKYMIKKENLSENHELGGESEIKILLDVSQDDDMRLKGVAREIINRIQKLRKKSKLNIDDPITIFIDIAKDSNLVAVAFESNKSFIEQNLRKPFESIDKMTSDYEVIIKETFDYETEKFDVAISKKRV